MKGKEEMQRSAETLFSDTNWSESGRLAPSSVRSLNQDP